MTSSPNKPATRPFCRSCGHRMHRHGDRRWRCVACRTTQRVHKQRRGPKLKRGTDRNTVYRFLAARRTVRDLATRNNWSYGKTHERLQRGLAAIARQPLELLHWPQGLEMVLVADALWLLVDGKRVTIYAILLRGLDNTHATVVLLFPTIGHECSAGWRQTFAMLPEYIREHVVGVTHDGHAGLHLAAWDSFGAPGYPVSFQRCHFHFLADFRMRLSAKAISSDPVTRLSWFIGRRVLAEHDDEQRIIWLKLLELIRWRLEHNSRTQKAVRWFLKFYRPTTSAFAHPELHIPTTTGSAETVCKRLRRLLDRMRPTSLERVLDMCHVFLRRYPSVRCVSRVQELGNL